MRIYLGGNDEFQILQKKCSKCGKNYLHLDNNGIVKSNQNFTDNDIIIGQILGF